MRILPKFYQAIFYYYKQDKAGVWQIQRIQTADGVARSLDNFMTALKRTPRPHQKYGLQVLEGSYWQRLGVMLLPRYYPKYRGTWHNVK